MRGTPGAGRSESSAWLEPRATAYKFVIAGLVPAIHVFASVSYAKTWMPGRTRPGHDELVDHLCRAAVVIAEVTIGPTEGRIRRLKPSFILAAFMIGHHRWVAAIQHKPNARCGVFLKSNSGEMAGSADAGNAH